MQGLRSGQRQVAHCSTALQGCRARCLSRPWLWLLSVGFMAAARAAERGARVELGLLFDGLRQAPAPQLVLGVAYLLCLAAVIAASCLVDGGALARMLVTGGRPEVEDVESGGFGGAAVTVALLYAPVMMMFWFAPPLAAWHGAPPAKALFFSAAAFLMNWRAFVTYGAACLAATFALSGASVTRRNRLPYTPGMP